MRVALASFGAISVLLLSLSSVAARQFIEEGSQRSHNNVRRHLKQGRQLAAAVCPEGCAPGACAQDGTQGGLRCNKCLNNLVVVKASGVCACVAGQYASAGSCLDCPKASYCPGGIYSATPATTEGDPPSETPVKVNCSTGMTTLGKRSISISRCVNQPGTYYSIDPTTGAATAVPCPADSYGPGLKKQRGCVPCPTGFKTNGLVAQSSPAVCVVPAGYYLKGPGQVAPCPKGEWKEGVGTAGNCTKCTQGATTAREASTSPDDCQLLKAGFYAVSIASPSRAITAAAVCPQGFVCPGNTLPVQAFDVSNPTSLSATEPSIQACPLGQWTRELGATSLNQCLTPPGHFTANSTTQPCPSGWFRPDWKPAAEAGSCTPCGDGVLADATDRVTTYSVTDGTAVEVSVTSSADDCYIQTGQGLYYETLSKAWRAKNCDDNSYGVTAKTYGLSPTPCKPCPTNMITSKNATAYPLSAAHYTLNADNSTGGFTSVMACVTKAGYGYNGRIAQRCDQGTYNEGGNYNTCLQCPSSTTTAGPGAGKSASDCKAAAGYVNGSPCPLGTYNDVVASSTATCKPCPNNTTTEGTGATDVGDCKRCRPGYGGSGGSTCPDKCGGIGALASYGPVGRAAGSPCIPCEGGGQTVGFSFIWGFDNDVFAPQTVAREGASSPLDCIAEFGQYQDAAWYLPLQSDIATNVTNDVQTFADCVAMCPASSDCQFVTYDYVQKTCTVRNGATVVYEGTPWVGFKALPSGYTATNPWSLDQHPEGDDKGQTANLSAKAVAGGLYTWWQDPNALVIGEQTAPAGVEAFSTVQDCVTACDYDGVACVGVTLEMTVDRNKLGTTCKLIRGNGSPGKFKRTAVRTELTRVGFPTSFLCPSGWTENNEGTSACIPIITPQQLSFVLTAVGTCNETTIESVKQSFYAFLSDPTTNYGVYTPNLVLEVGCLETDAYQGGYGFSRRRLQQLSTFSDTKVALWVLITFTGTTEPVVTAVELIDQDPCKISGFCSTIEIVDVLQVTAGAINTTDLLLTPVGYTPGSLRFKTAYVQDGVEIPNAAFLLRSNRAEINRGGLGTCGSDVSGNTRSWNCEVYIPAGDTITLSVTVPNTLDPAKPITKTLDVIGPGTSPCPSQCASVTNSTGDCLAIYGGVGVVCGCQTGFAWDADNGTCAIPCLGAPPTLSENTWPGTCTDGLLGYSCTGTCAPGFINPPTATCVNPTVGWRTSGGCVAANCSNTLPSINNATWSSCQDSGVGVVCTAACDGYFVQSAPITSTCAAVVAGAEWPTPTEFCGLINSQAVLAIEASVSGGTCLTAATDAVKASVETFMATHAATAAASAVSVSCSSGGSSSVRYVVVVTYFGGETAAQALVTAVEADLNTVGTMITSVATATTNQVTIPQTGTAQWSGGGATPRNPQQTASLYLMRSGPDTNIQSGVQFFLTAVYTGSSSINKQGATITGPTISPASAVTCTTLDAAPATDALGAASWSCVTGAVGQAVTIAAGTANGGDTLSASLDFTIGTDCVGAFANYSDCDNVCGAGNKTRSFTVTTPAANGGRACAYADGYVDTAACSGPITCGECNSCGITACIAAASGSSCPNQGKCYDGVCQPTSKIFEVTSVGPILYDTTYLDPAWLFYGMNGTLPANNTQWIYQRLVTAATGGIQSLAGEVGLTTPAIVNGSIVSTAPTDPRTDSPITTALRLVNPRLVTSSDRADAAVWYRNNTPSHPPGLFNGMKFRDFINSSRGNGTIRFSWYRGNWSSANAPVLRFTVLNPALLPAAAADGAMSRIEFVFEPANNPTNYPGSVIPTNRWVTEELTFTKGKVWVFMGPYSLPIKEFQTAGDTLNNWMNPTKTISTCLVRTSYSAACTTSGTRLYPWVLNGTQLFGTDDIWRDGIIWEVRVGALNAKTWMYANNVQLATKDGESFTYVFT